jgi:short-subunit dehydrogenase
MNLPHKTILITGASQGIGAALARAFARYPVKLALLARSEQKLLSLAVELNQLPGVQALPVIADISQKAAIQRAMTHIAEAFGPVDILVNNAGVGMHSPAGQMDEATARQLFDLNFWGAIAMTEAVLPEMRRRKDGLIINISSIVGRRAMPGIGIYSASKFALNAYSESIRVELKDENVRVVSFYPGVTVTNFGENLLTGPNKMDGKGRAKVSSAEEVARAIVRAAQKEPRDAYATLFDRFFVLGAQLAPWLMDKMLGTL